MFGLPLCIEQASVHKRRRAGTVLSAGGGPCRLFHARASERPDNYVWTLHNAARCAVRPLGHALVAYAVGRALPVYSVATF